MSNQAKEENENLLAAAVLVSWVLVLPSKKINRFEDQSGL